MRVSILVRASTTSAFVNLAAFNEGASLSIHRGERVSRQGRVKRPTGDVLQNE